MLDDRLTSAGLALREAPVPDAELGGLAARQRRRTTRRAGAVAVAVALVAGLGVVAEQRRHDEVRVVDEGSIEVQVPTPTGPPQLLPDPMPDGWALERWGEGYGSPTSNRPQVQVYGTSSGAGFTTDPYVVVLEVPSDVPSTRTADDAEIGDLPYGLRSMAFGLGDRGVTVAGSQVSDDELRAVAEGVAVAGGQVVVHHVPAGFHRILSSTDAFSMGRWSRTLELRAGETRVRQAGPGDVRETRTITLTTDDSTFVRLEQIAWRYPGTTVIHRSGHEILRHRWKDRITWTWLEGDQYVQLQSALGDEDVLAEIARTLQPVTTEELARRVQHLPADAHGMASLYALMPRVPYLDDTVDDVRERRLATFMRTPEGDQVCAEPSGCHPLPDAAGALVTWLPLDQHVASFAVRDDVASVAVRYAGRATRVMAPVRVVPGQPRVVGVIQPDDLPVASIEARAADGTVLQVVEGPLRPWNG